MPDSSADRDPLDVLAEEFVTRYRAGERPPLSEFAERLPDRADEVRDLFPALVEMEQLKPHSGELTGDFAAVAEPCDPVRVGEFRILRRVGHGGMGVVYEAVQESLGRHVALKLMPLDSLADPKRLERFRREAKAAAKLHHTNIVPVFGTGEADGRHFYAMQFIDGHPLDAVIDEVRRLKDRSAPTIPRAASEVAEALMTGSFTGEHATAAGALKPPSLSGSLSDAGRHYWEAVARIGAQAADALAYAHHQGVLHRDVKPANLLLDLQGTVWVTDFGLAKSTGADDLTGVGDVVGTLRYLAPERFEGAGDHRADVYALGLTLYEMLTLRPAFQADNRAKLVEQVLAADPPRPRAINPAIPRDLETIVLKAIARDQAMRYPSAMELGDDLRRFVEDRPIRARRAGAFEHTVRWCRRNPVVAGLTAAVVMVTAIGFVMTAYHAALAATAATKATSREQEANAARDIAQRQVVRFDILTAAHQAERGERELALHWVARAWQDDVARIQSGQRLDDGAEANHRLRVATAIDRLPQLVGFCPHDKPVADADCDPTGDRVVTVAADLHRDPSGAEFWTENREHVARVWNAGRAELAYPPLAHEGPVTSAVFSADGSRIATSSADGTARVWDAATGRPLHVFRPGGPVARVAFHPGGKTLAAVGGEFVSRWNLLTGEPAGAPLAVGGPADFVAYSPEGSKLVTVTLAGKARVWDAVTGKPLSEPLPFFRFGEKEFRAGTDFSPAMEWQRWPAFSADGNQLATADGSRIHVWSQSGVKTIATKSAYAGPWQIQVAFDPDGTRLIYVQRRDHRLIAHDLAANRTMSLGTISRLTCGLAVSPDGKRAAVSVSVGNTTLFDLSSGAVAGPVLRIGDYVTLARFTRDGQRLLTASWDGTVRLWQPAELGRPREPYRMDCGRADRLEFADRRFSPDGKLMAVYDKQKMELSVGKVDGELALLPRRLHKFVARFSPGGRHLATFSADAELNKFVIESWALGDTGPKSVGAASVDGLVKEFAFSEDGRRLALSARSRAFVRAGHGSSVDQFFVYDFPSLGPLLGPVGADLVRLNGRLALSRDGGLLVVGQLGTARVPCWDVRTGEQLAGTRGRAGDIHSMDVGFRDDRVLLSVSDGTTTQWDVRAGQRVGPTVLLPANTRAVGNMSSCGYDARQTRIVQLTRAAASSFHVNVFSAQDGDLLTTFSVPAGSIHRVVWFSADGRRVIAHQRGTANVHAWTLPEYTGPLESLPTLVRLLTGTDSDPIGGFFPLGSDVIRTDPETYRRAFRAYRGFPVSGP